MPSSRIGLLICIIVCLAPSVSAAPRFEKRTQVEVQVAPRQRTRAEAPRDKPAAPGLRADQLRERAARLARLDDRAIETLERLEQRLTVNDPELPDVRYRLAEHYREKKTRAMFGARELDEVIHRNPGQRAALEARQRALEAEERRWVLKAVAKYLAIAESPEAQSYRRLDEVLYGLAELLAQVGRRDRARQFFSRLIRNHPHSRYIPDAYLSFAEHYFAEGRVEEALRLYQQVGKYPASPLHGYAVYKQGWCWLNLKDPRRALESFVQVIRDAERSGRASRILLLKEARKDAVRAYSHVGSPEKALEFFRRIGGDRAGAMLEQLAAVYGEQGKFVPAIQTYRRLMAREPGSQKLCSWQYAIARATLSALGKPEQAAEAERLASLHEELEGGGRGTAASRSECRSSAGGVLRELATTWHREAQRTRDPETYRLAVRLYRRYLAGFPREKDSEQLAYYLGEALYSLESWPEAADAYTRVVQLHPRGKHAKAAAYAAVICWLNAMAFEDRPPQRRGEDVRTPLPFSPATRRMVAALQTYRRVVPGGDERVTVLYREARAHYEHNHYTDAVPLFAEIVEKHPDHELAPYAANLWLDCLNLLGRGGELRRVVDRLLGDPRLRRGELSGQLEKLRCELGRKSSEALQASKRFRECGDAYVELADRCPADPRWAELLHNAALCYEAAKMIGLAIAARTTLIRARPDAPLAQRAHYLIGQNYHALAWYSRAAEHYERFAARYPGEREAPDALQNAMLFRLGRGELEQAADDARLFQQLYGARPALVPRAAAVSFALGAAHDGQAQGEAALKHYESYLRRWGSRGGLDRQIEAHVRLGELLWARACPTDARASALHGVCARVVRAASRRLLPSASRRRAGELPKQCGPESKMRITLVERTPGPARAAQRHFERALALAASTGQPLRDVPADERERRRAEISVAIASALFHRAELRFEELLRLELPRDLRLPARASRGNPLLVYLAEKGRRLEQARLLYEEVIKRRVAHWAIAASARVGQLYQAFADALYTAPIPAAKIPAALTTAASRQEYLLAFAEQYCDGLADRARPLEEMAVQGLTICLNKSTQLSTFNEWSRLCEAELNQIRADFPLAVEIRPLPGYGGFRLARVGLQVPGEVYQASSGRAVTGASR